MIIGILHILGIIVRIVLVLIFVLIIIAFIVQLFRPNIMYGGEDEWVEQLYESAISRLEQAIENKLSLEEFEDEYEFAIDLDENRVDAYCKKAKYLYVLDGTETAEQYIDDIIELPLEGKEEYFAELYFIYAKCKLYREDYDQARKYSNMAAEKGMREDILATIQSEINPKEIYEGEL